MYKLSLLKTSFNLKDAKPEIIIKKYIINEYSDRLFNLNKKIGDKNIKVKETAYKCFVKKKLCIIN